jgi:rhodanese-related sulfurtransferase/DNA-binding transcriptional ArsR family regulator
MDKREFKNKVYSLLSRMVKAMANPHRLEIIDLLAQSDRTVEEIAIETEMSVANASQHLQVLKASNLVDVSREGNFIRYRLADKTIYKSWYNLRKIGFDKVPEIYKLIKDYREKKNVLEAVSISELMQRMKTKKIILLDIRPVEEYNAGHIQDAISVPIDKLPAMLKKLLKSKEYIAYCRGSFCVFADDAVQILKRNGFNAKRLEEGFPDWELKGLPIHINQ